MDRMPTRQGDVVWTPPADVRERSVLGRYLTWLERNRGRAVAGYEELWQWSVTDLEGFWGSLWDFFEIKASRPYQRVLGGRAMPGASWFPGAELNYAENALRRRDDHPALVFKSEGGQLENLSYAELYRQ